MRKKRSNRVASARVANARVASVGVIVAVGILLTGCSGSSGGAASTTPSTTAASTDEADATDQSADGGVDNQDSVDASVPEGGTAVNCKQLAQADVQPLMAGTIDSVTATAAGDDDTGQQCDFAGGDGDVSVIDILVLKGAAATSEYADTADGEISVPGVGDKAVRADGDVSVTALKDDTYCSVSVGDPGDLPGIGDFEAANEGSSDIPDPVAGAAAAALGTLCNRIFGSGNTTPDLGALAAALAAAATASPSAAPTS
jgi:hypothetical protein